LAVRHIQLRGVEVHNLKRVDLDLPHRKLIVFCGVSGSGKTSLALDTLYAEGQRRYIESFSAYTRQFLERLEKPAAERIDGIPPAIAVTRKSTSRSSRSTVGTTTETADYLRLLFAKIGRVICRGCGRHVQRDTPQSAADRLSKLPAGTRYMLTFERTPASTDDAERLAAELKEDGFVRVVVGERIVNLADEPLIAAGQSGSFDSPIHVVVDRLSVHGTSIQRLRDSLETAFVKGEGRCSALVLGAEGAAWSRVAFSNTFRCEECGIDYPPPEPRLYSFNSPLGACPDCEGFGSIIDIDMDLVVPDPNKTLREGAVAPWNTPAYAHELEEMLALSGDYELPVDVPFRELNDEQLRLIREGVPEREFGGLRGFFAWLERRKYKMHLRVFLSRWRSYHICPACNGQRLRPEALATQIGGKNIAEISQMKIADALDFFRGIELTDYERTIGRIMLQQVQARLGFLDAVGLGYLTLDRTLRTLSGGEAQRVALTSTLGSSLVNMLYVLDEPSIGLHPRDVDRLISAIGRLRDRGNTVILVEHEESMLRTADQIVEIGPGAGERGGQVVFQGTLEEMQHCEQSLTGDYLFGRRGVSIPEQRRQPSHGWIRLAGARGNNLKNVTVEFPLGMLCVVTGVSGSGKSTLVQDTLYGALCRRKRKDAPKPQPYDDVYGDGQIDDVVLVDQSPISRSPRSNPVTYIKAFDEIRAVFADTVDARTHNYTAGHFSFNVDGGRCSACQGDGHIEIDMQFLADVYMRCSQCGGTRYRKEILAVTYRGRNIADVLVMTVREAFSFFRGQRKVQAKLKRLIDVGLDYLRLGQPANTLSAGEAQRLKLAAHLSSASRNRTLFLLDEPTTGLHFSDIVKLLDCFEALLSVGHSLIVVEHNLQLMKAADYIIDLGPGAADLGGQVVVQGTPEKVARHEESVTAGFLAAALAMELREQPT
jgi:excinuclease ABC subunit A